MLRNLILSVIIGVLVALAILLVGIILVALHIPVLHDVGSFLETWCWVFGVIAAIWAYLTGWRPFGTPG